ncbi:expressed unknown protein [Seminavis robusta]|uniref:Uncharacterized protein n=1 Tax=Seminavis robusta TaxID=568900 RepID=A0A9N8H4R4_9STRA|nr:expressed unknown protein [Seminavis robusta]|eukprot:Sro69_g038720.1 n/a (1125) ;mRNA; r:125026-128400
MVPKEGEDRNLLERRPRSTIRDNGRDKRENRHLESPTDVIALLSFGLLGAPPTAPTADANPERHLSTRRNVGRKKINKESRKGAFLFPNGDSGMMTQSTRKETLPQFAQAKKDTSSATTTSATKSGHGKTKEAEREQNDRAKSSSVNKSVQSDGGTKGQMKKNSSAETMTDDSSGLSDTPSLSTTSHHTSPSQNGPGRSPTPRVVIGSNLPSPFATFPFSAENDASLSSPPSSKTNLPPVTPSPPGTPPGEKSMALRVSPPASAAAFKPIDIETKTTSVTIKTTTAPPASTHPTSTTSSSPPIQTSIRTNTNEKLELLEQQVQTLQKQLEQSQAQIQSLSSNINNNINIKPIQQPCQSCIELAKTMEVMERENSEWKTSLGETMEAKMVFLLQQETIEWKNNHQALEKKHKDLEMIHAKLQQKLVDLEQERMEWNQDMLEDTLKLVQGEKDVLQVQLDQQTRDMWSMREDLLEEASNDRKEARDAVSLLQSNLNQIQETHRRVQERQQTELDVTKQNCGEMKSALEALQQENILLQSRLEEQATELADALDSAQKEKVDLHDKLERQDTDIQALQEELGAAARERQQARDLVSGLQYQMEVSKLGEKQVQQAIAQLQAQADDAKKGKLEVEQKMTALASENVALRSLLDIQRCEMSHHKECLDKAQEEFRDGMSELRSEAETARQSLEASQERIKKIEAERDAALLKSKDGGDARTQQGNQAATEEYKSRLAETDAKVAQLTDMFQTSEAEKSSLQTELLAKLHATEEKIELLETQNDNILKEKEEIKAQLESQVSECRSIRKDVDNENARAKESTSRLQAKVAAAGEQYHELQQALATMKADHQGEIHNVQVTEATSREKLQSSLERHKAAVLAANHKIAAMEKTLLKVEEENAAIQEKVDQTRLEIDTMKSLVEEKDKAIEDTTHKLAQAQMSLITVSHEKDMVLGQLALAAEKCSDVISATDEMKVLLEDDEKQIMQLHTEREHLVSRLHLAHTKGDSAMPETPPRRDSFEVDPEELLRNMSMPESLEDSMSFVGTAGGDVKKGSTNRRASILALEELEQDLRDLLFQSEELLPEPQRTSPVDGGERKGSMLGGRHMSLFVKQQQRDSAEEALLKDIQDLE